MMLQTKFSIVNADNKKLSDYVTHWIYHAFFRRSYQKSRGRRRWCIMWWRWSWHTLYQIYSNPVCVWNCNSPIWKLHSSFLEDYRCLRNWENHSFFSLIFDRIWGINNSLFFWNNGNFYFVFPVTNWHWPLAYNDELSFLSDANLKKNKIISNFFGIRRRIVT